MLRSLATVLLSVLVLAAPAHAQAPPPPPAPAPADAPVDWESDGFSDDPADDEVGADPEAQLPPAPELPPVPVPTTRTIKGKVAYVRADGKAAIPRGAPASVRRLIAAANLIVGKPYKWGGGHARLVDRGYDCSGAVSYALIRSSQLLSPLVSGGFARWGVAGAGRWVSVYANSGHVYMEVAGLRFDTSPVGDPAGRTGVRWRPVIGRRPKFTARHVAGL